MSTLRSAFATYLRPRRLWLVVLLVAAGAVELLSPVAHGPGHAHALANYMREHHGLYVNPSTVHWLDSHASRFHRSPTMFLAHERGGLDDVYYATAYRGSGTLWGIQHVRNLTRTSSANEDMLLVQGNYAVYTSKVGAFYDALVILDLRGEPAAWTAHWPWHARIQNAITNLQEEGRFQGFGRHRFQIEPAAKTIRLELDTQRVFAYVDHTLITLNPAHPSLHIPARLLSRPTEKGQPGVITWMVDTVRNVPWIGPAPIEWLEHRVFTVKDWFERTYYSLVDTNTSADAIADMGLSSSPSGTLLQATDPELHWPPPSLVPVIRPSARGEGEWVAVANDPFANAFAHAPPAFYQTFVRVDPERTFARVYITLWDPRQVQLHIAMGTKEPESATGETGTGMIPRDPATLRHLVAGFNGGFQALHGEFGMMAERRVYLPPKPWAATVAVFDDGSVGMGSWPAPPDERSYDEQQANEQIPDTMVAMRQNLTSVVEDEVWNPWQRWWWGAAPLAANEQTYIDRSGLCLTKEGFLAFFWGQSMGAEALGQAMLAARCVRGIHLDMNSKHTGFEFYKVFAPSEPRPPLTEALDDSKAEMPMPDAAGYMLRARKAVRTMGTMRFPRWVRRDPRDFFFLTLKPVLPGPDVTFGRQGPIQFSTAGVPHAGWPHAFARACIKLSSEACTWVVRIDPQRAHPQTQPEKGAKILGYINSIKSKHDTNSRFGVVATKTLLGWTYAIGTLAADSGHAQLVLSASPLSATSDAQNGLGIDADGFWVVIQRHARDSVPLMQRFTAMGIQHAAKLTDHGAAMVFVTPQGPVSVEGHAESNLHPEPRLALVANERPAAHVMYPDNTPLPYRRWGYAQGRRVRYFPEGPPRFRAPGMQPNE